MDRTTAITQIREAARLIVQQLMRIHPALPGVGDAETQGDCLKLLHQITTDLESIKKKLARLEARDESAEL